jgi:hypothetical protein
MSMPAGWRRDGDGLIALEGETLRERRKLLWNGARRGDLVIDQQARAKGRARGQPARHRGYGRESQAIVAG